jgi:predicted nucleic acid-binding protein
MEGWLHEVVFQFAVTGFPSNLGEGECQAIAMAERLGARLIVDDNRARKEAERRGITCLSTLRLLAQAKREGLVSEVASILSVFRVQGFWLSDSVVQRYLVALGER